MPRLAALLLALPALACSVGPDGGPDPADQPDAAPAGTTVAGTITAPATWSGAVEVTGDTTIAAGVTVTVSPGATITVDSGATLLVRGTLDVQGSAAGPVTIQPASPGGAHGGFFVDGGGRLGFAHVGLTGGGVHLATGGTATIADSRMSRVTGDLLTMDGGTLDVQYSQLGVDEGARDSTHCEMHFDNPASSIRITHSNIGTGAYGVMFYGGTGAVFTNDNWYGNAEYSVHTVSPVGGQPGVSGDFTGSWFDRNNVVEAAGTSLTGVVVNPSAPRNVAGPRT